MSMCAQCRKDFTGGWHLDPETGQTYRCPSMVAARNAETAIREASKNQREAALRIVKDAAQRMPEFTANDIQAELEAAQIDSQGATGQAFRTAHARGWIEPVAAPLDPSVRKRTHGKGVSRWRSRLYGARRTA